MDVSRLLRTFAALPLRTAALGIKTTAAISTASLDIGIAHEDRGVDRNDAGNLARQGRRRRARRNQGRDRRAVRDRNGDRGGAGKCRRRQGQAVLPLHGPGLA